MWVAHDGTRLHLNELDIDPMRRRTVCMLKNPKALELRFAPHCVTSAKSAESLLQLLQQTSQLLRFTGSPTGALLQPRVPLQAATQNLDQCLVARAKKRLRRVSMDCGCPWVPSLQDHGAPNQAPQNTK